MQTIIHYSLHFLLPGIIAWFFYREYWVKVWLLLLATMLIDLDHLLATPIFDANRCSINFHPLHKYYSLGIYILFLFFKRTRIIGIGLVLHILTDWLDCLSM
ncbi:DUF6122 family protein [Patiriisocius hiemis]|uniref:DUF6122 family protein n=1 Tax=Patiriisocius hiemis TaxID=3075604 RepID=A0ABU2YAR6_9FLAO|nr:DUF6122 family protein [Constantimarinum sp. W242]MDT0554729.1 DUF6122 family protein [Constantimarinum sp. W242]